MNMDLKDERLTRRLRNTSVVGRTSFKTKLITLLKKPVVIGALILVLAVFFGYALLSRNSNLLAQNPKVYSNMVDVKKDFTYKVPSSTGTSSSLIMHLDQAERTNVVTVKGQQLYAPADKSFLVLNFSWENQTTQDLTVKSPNFFRFTDSSGMKYAPAFYNDSITVSPISVAKDKVAFIIGSSDKNATFQVGELEGPKQDITIQW